MIKKYFHSKMMSAIAIDLAQGIKIKLLNLIFDDQISKNPYVCPIPDGVMPPISKD